MGSDGRGRDVTATHQLAAHRARALPAPLAEVADGVRSELPDGPHQLVVRDEHPVAGVAVEPALHRVQRAVATRRTDRHRSADDATAPLAKQPTKPAGPWRPRQAAEGVLERAAVEPQAVRRAAL